MKIPMILAPSSRSQCGPLFILGALLCFALTTSGSAATLTVNSVGDAGTGTGNAGDLRYCINSATSGADTIVFDSTLFATPQTIALNGTELGINTSVTIQGPGEGLLTIDARQASRVFNIGNGNFRVILAGLTMINGNGSFSGNGGGIANFAALTLTNCTLSGNTANNGGGVENGGTLTLINCTFFDNKASGGEGGGLRNADSGAVTLTNCTFSGNSAAGGGGAITNFATVSLTHCSLFGNQATGDLSGGGIHNGGTATLRNSIVARNTQGGDISGVINASHSLIGDGSGGITNTNGNLVGTMASPLDPKLSPLGNYGGPTETMVPLPDSPAIDAGTSPSVATTPTGLSAGTGTVTPSDNSEFSRGEMVIIDEGLANSEVVTITGITATSFTAKFAKAHAPGATISAFIPSDQRRLARVVQGQPDMGAVEAAYTMLTGPGTTLSYGQGMNVTATVANATPAGGTLQFFVDDVLTGMPVAVSNGSAVASITGLGAGSHTVTALYDNGSSPEGNSDQLSQSVNKATAIVHVTGYTTPFTGNPHMATGMATGANGEDLSSLLDLSATAHTNAQSYSDTWSFAGNGNYLASNGPVTDVINKVNAIINVSGYSVDYDGNPHTGAARAKGVDGRLLGGFNLAGTTHTNAGNFTDSWTFTDSTGNYNNASGMVNDLIGKANATITVTPYNVLANGNPHTATGTTIGVKGETLSGLVLTGTTHTSAGDYPNDSWTFTDGTGNYNGATGTVHDIIANPATTTTLTSRKSPSAFGDAVSFTAAVSPTVAAGTVQFKIDGANFGGPVTLNNGLATSGSTSALSLGNHTITAVYSGSPTYLTSTGTFTQVVAVPLHIDGSGKLSALINFGFDVRPVQDSTSAKGFKGHLDYQDKSVPVAGTKDGLKFRSTSITSEFAVDSRHGIFSGIGTLNGVTGLNFIVTVEDNGDPGKGQDQFHLVVLGNGTTSTGYDSDQHVTTAGALLTDGNIKLHYTKDTFSKGSLIGTGSVLKDTVDFDIDVMSDSTGGFTAGAGIHFYNSSMSFDSMSITGLVAKGNVVTATGTALYNATDSYTFQLDWDTGKKQVHAHIFGSDGKPVYDSGSIALTTGSVTYTALN